MSFYRTRYRGSKSPTTVELETKNNQCLGEDEDEEELQARRQDKKKKFTRRHGRSPYSDDDDDDDDDGSYCIADEEELDDSDPEVATAKALLMQGRGPGPASPFRWAGSPISDDSSMATHAARTLMTPPPVVPALPVGNGPNIHLYDGVNRGPPRHSHPASASGDGGDGSHNIDSSFSSSSPHQPPLFHAVKRLPGYLALAEDDDGKRNTWTADEDKILASLVDKYGPKKWGIVATYLPMRNAKQCHQRWHYVLKPSISRETWTEREDYIIYHYQRLLGNKWSHIAKYLSGRTGYAVRNRHAFLVKHYKGGKVPAPPGESLPSTNPKTNGKPIRRTNNSIMAAHARKMKKLKKQMAAVGVLHEFKKVGFGEGEDRKRKAVDRRREADEDKEDLAEDEEAEINDNFKEAGIARTSTVAGRAGGNLRVSCGLGDSLADVAPVARTPPPSFTAPWATSPRSSLDLLATLPHVDLMQLSLPSPSPRSRSFFDTHFPNLGSPQQAHPMPSPHHPPHMQPPVIHSPSPLSVQGPPASFQFHRHPMESCTSPSWAAGVGVVNPAPSDLRSFASPQTSPRQPTHHILPSFYRHNEEQKQKHISQDKERGEKDVTVVVGTAVSSAMSVGEDEALRRHRENAQMVVASWNAEGGEEGQESCEEEESGKEHARRQHRSEDTDRKVEMGVCNEGDVEEAEEDDAEEDDGREYGLRDLALAAAQEAAEEEVDDDDDDDEGDRNANEIEEEEEVEEEEEEKRSGEEEEAVDDEDDPHYHVKRPKL
ncbi:myb-like dna-binding domain containing protein [Nannochloropsis oceanica]